MDKLYLLNRKDNVFIFCKSLSAGAQIVINGQLFFEIGTRLGRKMATKRS